MKLAVLAFVGAAGLASVAGAQTIGSFVLNDGLFRYSETTQTGGSGRTGTGNGSANFGLASGTGSTVTNDYLFQNWWWYRSAGDTREFALSNQAQGLQLSPNSAYLRYDEPIGGSSTNGTLSFDFTYTLNQISATQAAVTINWNITNNSNVEQTMSFFAYTDSDMAFSSFSDDNGSYIPGAGINTYRNDNSVTDTSLFYTMSADLRLNDQWRIGPYSTSASNTASPLALLAANTAIDNLGNVDTAAGAADNSAAMQWNLVIPAGGSLGGRVTKGYNYVVPAPGTAALLGLGGLLAARRRR